MGEFSGRARLRVVFSLLVLSVLSAYAPGALQYFDEFERDQYATILQLLGEDAVAVLEANGPPVHGIVSGRWAEYLIVKNSDTHQRGYIMRIRQDETGIWRIKAL